MSRVALGLALCMAVGACAETLPPAPAARIPLAVGDVEVQARIAARGPERRRGLMGVRALGAREGMLFIYRDPKPLSIWMRGCHIALDVAFLDEAGRILSVATLPAPAGDGSDVARARSPGPAAMVLEVPAGFFARHGLGVGTQVALPASLDRRRADP